MTRHAPGPHGGTLCGAMGDPSDGLIDCPDCNDNLDLMLLAQGEPPSAPPGEPDTVHTAGLVVVYNGRLRQRCAWCGALLLDHDLTNIDTTSPDNMRDLGVATWEIGRTVAIKDALAWGYDLEPGDQFPPSWCGFIDPEVTGSGEAARG